jgi:hypothetical protein
MSLARAWEPPGQQEAKKNSRTIRRIPALKQSHRVGSENCILKIVANSRQVLWAHGLALTGIMTDHSVLDPEPIAAVFAEVPYPIDATIQNTWNFR